MIQRKRGGLQPPLSAGYFIPTPNLVLFQCSRTHVRVRKFSGLQV